MDTTSDSSDYDEPQRRMKEIDKKRRRGKGTTQKDGFTLELLEQWLKENKSRTNWVTMDQLHEELQEMERKKASRNYREKRPISSGTCPRGRQMSKPAHGGRCRLNQLDGWRTNMDRKEKYKKEKWCARTELQQRMDENETKKKETLVTRTTPQTTRQCHRRACKPKDSRFFSMRHLDLKEIDKELEKEAKQRKLSPRREPSPRIRMPLIPTQRAARTLQPEEKRMIMKELMEKQNKKNLPKIPTGVKKWNPQPPKARPQQAARTLMPTRIAEARTLRSGEKRTTMKELMEKQKKKIPPVCTKY